jgi:hypothetical protein
MGFKAATTTVAFSGEMSNKISCVAKLSKALAAASGEEATNFSVITPAKACMGEFIF